MIEGREERGRREGGEREERGRREGGEREERGRRRRSDRRGERKRVPSRMTPQSGQLAVLLMSLLSPRKYGWPLGHMKQLPSEYPGTSR